MPRSKMLAAYPNEEFWLLCDRAYTQGRMIVPCTKTEAMRLRGMLYGWREAVDTNPEQAASLGIDWSKVKALSFVATDEGLTAIMTSETLAPKLIRAALGLAPAEKPDETEAEASARKLLEHLSNLPKGDAGG